MKHGKHYVDAAKLIDRTKLYDMNEALELACKTATAKFDETVELHVKLGVDGRHADQQVRGAVVLPHGTGKTVRVAPSLRALLPLLLRLPALTSSVHGPDRRRSRRELDGLRRRYHHPGHDGRCWPSR